MSSVSDAQDVNPDADRQLREHEVASYVGRFNLRALIDVVLVGTPLALLLTWLALAIAAGR